MGGTLSIIGGTVEDQANIEFLVTGALNFEGDSNIQMASDTTATHSSNLLMSMDSVRGDILFRSISPDNMPAPGIASLFDTRVIVNQEILFTAFERFGHRQHLLYGV